MGCRLFNVRNTYKKDILLKCVSHYFICEIKIAVLTSAGGSCRESFIPLAVLSYCWSLHLSPFHSLSLALA